MNYVTPLTHVSLPLCWRSLPNSWVTILCLYPMLVYLKVPYLTIFSIYILSQVEHLSTNINMYDSKFTTLNWSSHSNSRSCVSVYWTSPTRSPNISKFNLSKKECIIHHSFPNPSFYFRILAIDPAADSSST